MVPGVDPGFTRVRRGSGFSYLGPDGEPPGPEDRARIDALAIPPAWTDVWISADPDGHIQVTGEDAAGREQYRYHPQWQAEHAHAKFDRMLRLAGALPHARAGSTRSLKAGDPRDRMLGAAFRILDEGAPRVGSVTYLEKYGSRGLTTLRRRDASVAERIVTLSFPAKEHTHDRIELHDELLAELFSDLAGDEPQPDLILLSYDSERGRSDLTADEVNRYLRGVTGGHFSAKDFRTIRGTTTAAEALARIGPLDTEKARKQAEVDAVRAASEALCNTPAVARASYIDPRVFDAYEQGRVVDLDRSADAALLELIPLQG